MKAAGKKEKGRRLELRFAKLLREYGLDKDARRMFGSGSFSHFKSDILTRLPFHIECKNQEQCRFWDYWEQADAHRTANKTPMVVYTSNNRPIMVILKAEDFLSILKEIYDERTN